MTLSYLLTLPLVVTIIYIGNALWYSPLIFGKKWMRIMGVSSLSKEELQKIQKEMLPFYGLQLLLTITSTVFLGLFSHLLPTASALSLAGIIWLAFIMPTQVSGVIWGSTAKKYWLAQILIMTSIQLLSILFAAYVFSIK